MRKSKYLPFQKNDSSKVNVLERFGKKFRKVFLKEKKACIQFSSVKAHTNSRAFRLCTLIQIHVFPTTNLESVLLWITSQKLLQIPRLRSQHLLQISTSMSRVFVVNPVAEAMQMHL